jgi:predicted DCC family thiol-disulfide oxidoreductase YuxK
VDALNQASASDGPLVLYDGTCGLCQRSVQFLIAAERKTELRFASLQSVLAKELLKEKGFDPETLDSVVLLEAGQVYVESTAALKLARRLCFPWWLACAAMVLPQFLRDWGYRRIAKNRFRFFGRKAACLIPSPEVRARFLDAAPPTRKP